MDHAFRHDESLERPQIDRTVLEIDDEMAFEDEEELIVIVMLVPVILALQNPETYTESFTLHRVWLYQRSLQLATSAGTSTILSGPNLTSRCVA